MGTPATPEQLRSTVEQYLDAFARRDIDAAVACFAADAEMREPAGTFTGRDGVRQLLEWDVQLSPVAEARRTGIGLLAEHGVVVEEEILRQTYQNVSYEYPLVRIFEIDERGEIRRLRVYLDRLGMLQQITERLPGFRGRVFRQLIRFVVAQSEKGLARDGRTAG